MTLAQAKAWAKVTTNIEDDLVNGLIASARRAVENHTGYQLMPATWTLVLDSFPHSHRPPPDVFFPHVHKSRVSEIIVPRPPLVSVTHVKYLDVNGAQQTLAPTTFDVDTTGEPGRITLAFDKSWPEARRTKHAIEIEFVAGYADAASVPQEAKTAILIGVADVYDHRDRSTKIADNERLVELLSDFRTVGPT